MVILKHTDHLQVTNTQLGPQKCFGTNYLKFPKFQFTFTFLFSVHDSALLYVTQRSWKDIQGGQNWRRIALL